jgi:hypothetical protein
MEICAKWFSNVTKESRACDNSKKVYLMISLALSCLNRITFAFITFYVILYMNTFLLGHMQILLFNCMSVRDPMRLLPHLVNTSIQNGMMVKFSHSLNKYLCIHLSNKSGILSWVYTFALLDCMNFFWGNIAWIYWQLESCANLFLYLLLTSLKFNLFPLTVACFHLICNFLQGVILIWPYLFQTNHSTTSLVLVHQHLQSLSKLICRGNYLSKKCGRS